MDIVQLIADDHQEQRRLFGLIEEMGSGNPEGLKAVWQRLRVLLDVHALAEERLFYPALLKLGKGADGETPEDETRDAIKDHNEIRDAAAAVDEHEPGSAEWIEAVAAANKANSDHLAEEERQGLTDFRRDADRELRHRLGVDFIAFGSAHLTGRGVTPHDRDPDAYVKRNG
ncbi:cation-binding protein [Sphingomonas ginkgonis]|uniref:Cation-binding protein n=1 Tax=Sphingomonas ginkgonis TaxID=2315330 RepID=A0A429V689_9SPHN|nr:hemerythrin domain-containing protein [Sphingomonas ginkgonis]RST29440.1 cation-binding protein [Sphingomonas ginkgonis]